MISRPTVRVKANDTTAAMTAAMLVQSVPNQGPNIAPPVRLRAVEGNTQTVATL